MSLFARTRARLSALTPLLAATPLLGLSPSAQEEPVDVGYRAMVLVSALVILLLVVLAVIVYLLRRRKDGQAR